MKAGTVSRVADFTIRIMIMLSTVLVLLLFMDIGNSLLFFILTTIFLLAIIVKSLAPLFEKKKERVE
jgi:hypothetical protein